MFDQFIMLGEYNFLIIFIYLLTVIWSNMEKKNLIIIVIFFR